MKYLMCNLKSNKTLKEILEYKKIIGKINNENVNFVLFPSNIYLSFFYDTNYEIGTQDLSIYKNGNHTGETLAKQLFSLKVTYCILNHHEQNLSLDALIKKIQNATESHIKVVLCIGEEIEANTLTTKFFVTNNLDIIMSKLTKEEQENIIIAYEPIWAINQKTISNYEKINEIITELKQHLKLVYGLNNSIIYGGSINCSNFKELLKYDIIDGFLIGNCSLNPENIVNLLKEI